MESHLLRLLAHLALVHRSLGMAGDREAENSILQQYMEYLMTSDRLGLVSGQAVYMYLGIVLVEIKCNTEVNIVSLY